MFIKKFDTWTQANNAKELIKSKLATRIRVTVEEVNDICDKDMGWDLDLQPEIDTPFFPRIEAMYNGYVLIFPDPIALGN